MEVSSNSYFFARINRIGSVVELKFYIRVQEEFVLGLSYSVDQQVDKKAQQVHSKAEKGNQKRVFC